MSVVPPPITKAAFAAWLTLTLLALVAVGASMATPGEAGAAVQRLPPVFATSEGARPTAVIALHPHCPCSRATLGAVEPFASSLNLVLVISGPAAASFSEPPQSLSAWAEAHGADLHLDPHGTLATSLGALTSGHAALYDADKTLVFAGGLTPARGHAGPCPGATAARWLVEGRNWTGAKTAPVFGCPIFNAGCTPDLGQCGGSSTQTRESTKGPGEADR